PYLHLPEAWERAYDETSVLQHIVRLASRGMLVALFLVPVALFVDQVRARRFPLRRALPWGIATGVLSLAAMGLRWQSDVLWGYDPERQPYQLFVTAASISFAVQFVFFSIAAAALVGTLFAVRPQAERVFRGGHDERYARDALVLGGLGVLLQLGVRRLADVLSAIAPAHTGVSELFLMPAAARPAPWMDEFSDLSRSVLFYIPMFALVVHAAQRWLGPRRALVVAAAGLALWAGDGARSLAEFGLQCAVGWVALGALLFVLFVLFRGNDLAYVLSYLG